MDAWMPGAIVGAIGGFFVGMIVGGAMSGGTISATEFEMGDLWTQVKVALIVTVIGAVGGGMIGSCR